MTGLTAFVPEIENVEIPGGVFTVRGLAPEDFAVLLRAHHKPMSLLFDRYVNEAALEKVDGDTTGGLLNLGDMKDVVLEAAELAPALMGDVIARAADEHENPHMARLLPFGVQIDALGKILDLTLRAEGGMEKLVETVSAIATSLASAVANPSP